MKVGGSMIIKMTLNESHLTQIIERYFDDGGPFVQMWHNSNEEYKQFKKDLEKLHRYKFCSSEKESFKVHLENIIKQTFINYINSISNNNNWKTERFNSKRILQYKETILKQLEVKLVNLIIDKSFNNKVVYYFDYINKYITV